MKLPHTSTPPRRRRSNRAASLQQNQQQQLFTNYATATSTPLRASSAALSEAQRAASPIDRYESPATLVSFSFDSDISSSPVETSSSSANKMVWKRKQKNPSSKAKDPVIVKQPISQRKKREKAALAAAERRNSASPQRPDQLAVAAHNVQQRQRQRQRQELQMWESFEEASPFTSFDFDGEGDQSYNDRGNRRTTSQHMMVQTSNNTPTSMASSASPSSPSNRGYTPDYMQAQASPGGVKAMTTPFVSERSSPRRAQSISPSSPSSESFSPNESSLSTIPPQGSSSYTAETSGNNIGSALTLSNQSAAAPSPSSDLSHLLKPPVPEDRSEKRRMAYEKEKRLTGVYDGEMEPEGVRGQEAQVVSAADISGTSSSQHSNSPAMRSFDTEAPRASGGGKQVKILLTPTRETSLTNHSPRAASSSARSPGRFSATTTQPISPSQRNSHQQGQRPKPILRNSNQYTPTTPPRAVATQSDSSSTDSDDELQEMQSDLLPEDNDVENQADGRDNNYASNSGAPGEGDYEREDVPSPVAAAAAAAAARVLDNPQTNPAMAWPDEKGALSTRDDNDGVLNIDEWNQMAMKDVADGKYDSAIARFNRVLDWQKAQHGPMHPAVASAYHNLGTVHAKLASTLTDGSAGEQQAHQLALQHFQAAARTARDSLSPQHPNVAVSLVRIGFLLLQSKQYENAVITFEEALRIRKLAYGAKHGLVANLYNNLGVCLMHLGEFENAREALDEALEIQRANLSRAEKKSGNFWSLSLEVADTLFNIGGLSLECIRSRGPDLRPAQDAERALAETLQIRMEVLGPDDPLTLQVQDLLQMTRSIPVPRGAPATPQYEMEAMAPEEVLSVSTPTRPLSPSPSRDDLQTQGARSSTPSDIEINRSSVPSTPVSQADRYSVSERSRSGKSRSIPSPSLQQPATPLSSLPVDEQSRPATPSSLVSRSTTPFDETMDRSLRVLDRVGNSTTPPTSPGGRFAYDASLTPLSSTYTSMSSVRGRTTPTVRTNQSTISGGGDSDVDNTEIIRTRSLSPGPSRMFGEFRDLDGAALSDMYNARPLQSERSRRSTSVTPPINEVTVHRDDDDEASSSLKRTRVNVSSRFVPKSPSRSIASADVSGAPLLDETFDVTEDSGSRSHRYPFDTEENCLVADTGIDSEFGRIHIPPTWSKAGLVLDEEDTNERHREITVTRPSRVSSSFKLESSENDEVDYDTGNKERDDIMKRARDFLRAHENGGPTEDRKGSDLDHENGDFEEEALHADDGLADLGGDWPNHTLSQIPTLEYMTKEPTQYLHQIYDEACSRLKRNNVTGALPLFGLILQCQKQRYGQVHDNVASAAYNLGIARLRGNQLDEALDDFGEATRIRRAALGREHPAVAVSLVKVGITQLLLHRFENALWNFREALSIRKRSLGPLHPSTARIYNNIGCVHVEFQELREARRAFESALDIQRNALSEDPDSRGIMLATATTLCNLGYLYRHRDLHGKAALVLKEAADLQETVLGRSNPAVLSTLDNLADSCAVSGQTTEALRYFNMILIRYRVGDTHGNQTILRGEAILLYKMSRVHRQRNDRESQLDTLKLALRAVRAMSKPTSRKDTLERRIVYDMRSCRDQIEKDKTKWI